MINVSVDIGNKFAAYGNVFDRRDPARNRPAISIDDMFARKLDGALKIVLKPGE